MDTIVRNGIVLPRYYQVAKDRIESKQAMEPLSVAMGVGPVLGYDVVVPDTRFTITSSSINTDSTLLAKFGKFNTPKINKLSVDNLSGSVANAHFTPSGILSVDPDTLRFSSLVVPATILNNTYMLVAVKAKLIHPGAEPITATPSISNFTAAEIKGWNINGQPAHAPHIMTSTFPDVIAGLAASGFTIDHGTEVLIGIYQLGVLDSQKEGFEGYYNYYGNIIPMIPYGYSWPCSYPSTFTERMDFFNLLEVVANLSVGTTRLEDGSVTTPKLANNAVTDTKLALGAVTADKIKDASVSTSKIVKGSITTITLASGAVTREILGDNAVAEENILDNAISTTKLKNRSVTKEKIGFNMAEPVPYGYKYFDATVIWGHYMSEPTQIITQGIGNIQLTPGSTQDIMGAIAIPRVDDTTDYVHSYSLNVATNKPILICSLMVSLLNSNYVNTKYCGILTPSLLVSSEEYAFAMRAFNVSAVTKNSDYLVTCHIQGYYLDT